MTMGAQAGNSSECASVSHGPPVRAMCAPPVQQFQIRVAAANTVRAARLMVDALRSSTRNRLRCRLDKARRSVSGIRPSGRARRIHQGSRDATQFWNCLPAGRQHGRHHRRVLRQRQQCGLRHATTLVQGQIDQRDQGGHVIVAQHHAQLRVGRGDALRPRSRRSQDSPESPPASADRPPWAFASSPWAALNCPRSVRTCASRPAPGAKAKARPARWMS